jgi:hypothetical protein
LIARRTTTLLTGKVWIGGGERDSVGRRGGVFEGGLLVQIAGGFERGLFVDIAGELAHSFQSGDATLQFWQECGTLTTQFGR